MTILKRNQVEKIKTRAESMLTTYGPRGVIAQGSNQQELYDLCKTCLYMMDRVKHGQQMSIFQKRKIQNENLSKAEKRQS